MELFNLSPKHNSLLVELFQELKNLPPTWDCLENAKNSIYNLLQETYNKFLCFQSAEYQESEEFKKFLFGSLENIITASLHNELFRLICVQFEPEDEMIYKKCNEFASLKVTADQLGAMEDYAIPLPAAVVELASLDMRSTPAEKFNCFSVTFDLVLAELKGAIVDIIAHNSDTGIPTLNVADVTPILSTVIIHAKPLHLFSNMYYMENFRWSENRISDSECILAFRTAVDKLRVLTPDMLHPRSSHIYCDIGLEDVLKITTSVDNYFDDRGRRRSHPRTPLERHIEHFTTKIAAATLSNIHK